MNFKRHNFSPLLIAAFASFLCGSAFAYEVPAFHKAPFDRDGIFLSDGDRHSLLEALASVACNFPETSIIDEDLIEKSLAIALSIDPFHRNSRQAHEALIAGVTPKKTQYANSRSAVAETLWGIAAQFSSAPIEPEEERLAPLLMEISLLIHPAPTTERILKFDDSSKGRGSVWKGFVFLQEEVSDSNKRIQFLKREATTARQEGTQLPMSEPEPEPEPKVELSPEKPAKEMTFAGSVREEACSIVGVFPTKGSLNAGRFSLNVRAPSGPQEAALFPFLSGGSPEEYPHLPIFASDRTTIPMIGLTFNTERTRETNITWQPGAVGEVQFESSNAAGQSQRTGGVQASLPLILSLKAISESRTLNPSIGIIASYEGNGPSFLLINDPAAAIMTAKSLEMPYFLIHSNTLPALLESLSESENLELLFFSNLLSFNTLDEIYELVTLTEIPSAVSEADRIFSEIGMVSNRMPLPELARNLKVRERLEEILELVPNHYSAKAMLDFGRRPPSQTAILRSLVTTVDAAINPYFALRREYRSDTTTLSNEIEATGLKLSMLRSDVPAEALDYHDLAEEMIDAADVYLGLTNKTSSIAEQRLRELKELLDRLDAEREALGFGRRRIDG